MFPLYGFVGIFFLVFSFMFTYLNLYGTFYFNMDMFYAIGIWLFFDAWDFKLNKKSLIHSGIKYVFFTLILGAFLGVIIELYREYTSNVWVYVNPIDFLNGPLLFIFWGVCLPMFYESYVVFSTLLNKYFKFKIKKFSKNLRKNIFSILGIIGILFLLIPIIFYKLNSGHFFTLMIFGLWFVSEYILYKFNKKTLLDFIFVGDYRPWVSLIVSSLLVGVLWEIRNVLTGQKAAWIYIKTLPFLNYQIFGVPLLIILGWPFLYIIFLSFYKIFFRKDKRIY